MKIFPITYLLFALTACSQPPVSTVKKPQNTIDTNYLNSMQTAYFAAGCFWCVEAIFESIDGVHEVVSGYSGGKEKNPTYELVSTGTTKHAETVKVIYDSTEVTYTMLLRAFFSSHDPSTLNQQGPDLGVQYRSVIFYQTPQEKQLAEKYVKELLAKKAYTKITTEIVPLTVFYEAEIYHQNYEKNNEESSYIQQVSTPRLKRFKKAEPSLLKKEEKH
jgi:peptide-methionine (S)-S-oxide reductase